MVLSGRIGGEPTDFVDDAKALRWADREGKHWAIPTPIDWADVLCQKLTRNILAHHGGLGLSGD